MIFICLLDPHSTLGERKKTSLENVYSLSRKRPELKTLKESFITVHKVFFEPTGANGMGGSYASLSVCLSVWMSVWMSVTPSKFILDQNSYLRIFDR